MTQRIDPQKAADWLNAQWNGPKICPICGKNNWTISPELVELRRFEGGSLVVGGGSVFPLLSVTCTICGNTLLFNAIVAGLVALEEATAAAMGAPTVTKYRPTSSPPSGAPRVQ